ncbi:metallophosphoesterase family protein [Pelagicoccus sp. NFK12]|uniref:Phosphoesterase n=1 Tax=Pelagicoccus enzymogenes TaxID=2773457 RepID=A0A927II01_9BACT|nr:metallophosphoesterase family protein [Pelagicoccus enzymogenes]MBD5780751.1 metallophosphoesterase family protein [Pelagicoccus enzymogenes]MDQ8200085.1 metallophosphoesterase family protein [Pelagicoccus enzymogenes]
MSRKIAVISDTHGKVPERLLTHLSKADEIWHLGDVTQPHVLIPIQNLGRPLVVVKGNCDPYGSWPEIRDLEREGFRFRLQHHPPYAFLENTTAILYGHLHQPLDDSEHGLRALNPGAVTGPRHGSAASFAWLTFPEAGKWDWQVEPL